MKKTIVIVILVVYIASIVVVNFFGLKSEVFDGITYVKEIQCNSVTVQNETPVTIESKQMLGGKPLFMFDFIPADQENPYTAEAESIINNPNDTGAGVSAIIMAVVAFALALFFSSRNDPIVWLKLAVVAAILAGYKIFTYLSKIKAFYKEKQ